MASPLLARKNPLQQAALYRFSRPLAQDPNIKPVGNGHQFSYQPRVGPPQLSPRSSASSSTSSDEDADESDSDVELTGQAIEVQTSTSAAVAEAPSSDEADDGDEDDSDHDSDSDFDSDAAEDDPGQQSDRSSRAAESTSDSDSDAAKSAGHGSIHVTRTTVVCNFTIEEIDPMYSDCEGLDVLHPDEIESNRSRSRSRHKDLDKGMMKDLRNLKCSNDGSDTDSSPPEDDEEAFNQRRQALRRFRRVSMSSSFGKRTHSELSDDSDNDDAPLDVNDVGSSARRMRKRLHRGSLLFQDPPEPRIDELEEPDSSEDEYATENSLARELPYYTMEIMEMESG
ncbi:CBS/PB1 domain-containing protein [Purpureocillium lavendulum]|uniref:CBS/PB1 domain-containing protein n=1 Tax=Purpureocillium lavendulum TaxID=1247861 RepID=A0AB34FPL7_9HYPO|nr:CBS/PB1 domain-containing protein [Purpureocillium lavendulum]